MVIDMQRPLDVLGSSQDKKVIIELKSGAKITGTLRAFDSHINIWLDDAGMEDSEKKIKLGKVLVRGDNIVFISPEK
jgi:small nuclear ribonucleoprotein